MKTLLAVSRGLMIVVIMITSLQVAQAQGGSISVTPLHLDEHFEVGERYERSLTVKNVNRVPYEIHFDAYDVEIDSETHNVTFLPKSSLQNTQKSMASWLKPLSRLPFQLDPGEEKVFSFEVRVPKGVAANDYFASLNFSFRPVSEQDTVRMVQVKQSLGVLLLASVNAEEEELKAAAPEQLEERSFSVERSGRETRVKATVENTGLRYVQVKSQVKLAGRVGDVYFLKEGASRRIFPGESVTLEATMPSDILDERPLMTLSYSLWDRERQKKWYEKKVPIREGDIDPGYLQAFPLNRETALLIVLLGVGLCIFLWFRHHRKA